MHQSRKFYFPASGLRLDWHDTVLSCYSHASLHQSVAFIVILLSLTAHHFAVLDLAPDLHLLLPRLRNPSQKFSL